MRFTKQVSFEDIKTVDDLIDMGQALDGDVDVDGQQSVKFIVREGGQMEPTIQSVEVKPKIQ